MADMVLEGGMPNNAYRSYIEDQILTADPVKLIRILSAGAVEAIRDARAKLTRGDIKGRSAAITKAVEILGELSAALDHQRGGELSAALAALYDYAQRRLLAGNHEQSDLPLAEAERTLEPLAEAWAQLEDAGTPEQLAKARDDHFHEPGANPVYERFSLAC